MSCRRNSRKRRGWRERRRRGNTDTKWANDKDFILFLKLYIFFEQYPTTYFNSFFRIRREEEAKKAMEEARRLAEEMARKQAEMEARLKFNRTLQVEARGLEHSQDITRAFVFSYFELLQWLGLDIPEFEVLKLNQYW